MAAGDRILAYYGASLRRVANQTLPDAAFTTISWDTEDRDDAGMWTSGTNLVVPTGGDGLWSITVGVTLAAGLTGVGFVLVSAAGVGFRCALGDTDGSATAVLPLVATNVIQAGAYADTAAGTTMTARIHAYRVSR